MIAGAVERVGARYAGCGRFARHYVAGKLRHDPLTRALLEMAPLGRVLDLGCGRGQFACLLLESGRARQVVGLEVNGRLLADAGRALAGLGFEGRRQDLARGTDLPRVDTVLLVDVLYQLPLEAQRPLLAAACEAAGRRLLVRVPDPAAGLRAWFTAFVERAGRRFWPHAGETVAAQPVAAIEAQIAAAGFRVERRACSAGTPFGNVLLVATRLGAGDEGVEAER